jgi:hypothetical protein
MKRQLSPAAQTVWSAYESILENECVVTTTDRRALAAAIRAAAEQSVPDDSEGHYVYLPNLFEIADELEANCKTQ